MRLRSTRLETNKQTKRKVKKTREHESAATLFRLLMREMSLLLNSGSSSVLVLRSAAPQRAQGRESVSALREGERERVGERVQLDCKLALVAVQLNKQNVFAFLFAASRLGFSNFPRTSAPDAHVSAARPMGRLPQPRRPAGAALRLAGWARAQKDEAEP